MNKIGSTIADHAVADGVVQRFVTPSTKKECHSDERVIVSHDTGDRVTLWGVNVLTLDLLQMER